PNVAHRHCQFDMAHAFPANPGQSDLDTTAVTNHAAVLDPLILSTGAFPILDEPENAFAEKTAFFGLKATVIDGLRVLYFAFVPRSNGIRRRHRDGDIFDLIDLVQPEQLTGAFFGANHMRIKVL